MPLAESERGLCAGPAADNAVTVEGGAVVWLGAAPGNPRAAVAGLKSPPNKPGSTHSGQERP